MKRFVGGSHFLHQKLGCGEYHCLCSCPPQLVRPASILFLFVLLAIPCILWDLSSLTRDQTQVPAMKAQSPNHRTSREFPPNPFMSSCCCSVTQSCPTLCDPTDCSTPGFLSLTVSWSLLRLMFTESVMPSNHLILCCPFLLLPSIFPNIKVFSNELAFRIRWPKYWSFSFISPSNEYSRLISFRIYWFDLLAVQGTLKSLLQHHSLKASVLWLSAFFIIQLQLVKVTV